MSGYSMSMFRSKDDLYAAMRDDLVEARAWIAEATKMITDVTGGGSELFKQHGEDYRADLEFCRSRLRERQDVNQRRLVSFFKEKAAALEALQACEEYFDNRADADCDPDGFIPNEEMKLLSIVREALKKAGAR